MLAPVVLTLMIANTMAASGLMFAAWRISAFEATRSGALTEAKTRENAAGQAGFPFQDGRLREAA
jgi:hypothetical protein